MSSYKTDNILKEWMKIRNDLHKLEKKEEVIRKKAEREMNSNRKNNIEGENYIVIRKKIKKEILRRNDVPEKFWNKYSHQIEYFTYSVMKK